MKCVDVSKADVFEMLSKQKEVYVADYKRESLTNLYDMTIGEIHDILCSDNRDEYVFFIVSE